MTDYKQICRNLVAAIDTANSWRPNVLNDITRCHGIACLERRKCARHTAPIPENVLLSWADNLNPERAHMCPEFIYNIQTNSHD